MLVSVIVLVGCAHEEPAPAPAPLAVEPHPLGPTGWRVDGKLVGFAGAEMVVVGREAVALVDGEGQQRTLPLQKPSARWSAAVSADGRRVAVGHDDGDVSVIETGEGSARLLEGEGGDVVGAAFSPDGTRLVAVSDVVRPPPPPGKIPPLPPSFPELATVTLWSLDGHRPPQSWTLQSCIPRAVAWGESIAVVCGQELARIVPGRTAVRRTRASATQVAARGAHLATLDRWSFRTWSEAGPSEPIERPGASGLAWVGDTLLVAVPGAIELWQDEQLVRSLAAEGLSDASLAVSTDGAVVAASQGVLLLRWDLASGTPLPGGEGHASMVSAVAVSPDGASVASASGYGDVRVRDRQTGAERAVWWVPLPARITALAVAGDRVAALHDEKITLWEVGSERSVVLDAPDVNALAASADGLRARRGGAWWALGGSGLGEPAEDVTDAVPPRWPSPVGVWAGWPGGFVSGGTDGTLTVWGRQ